MSIVQGGGEGVGFAGGLGGGQVEPRQFQPVGGLVEQAAPQIEVVDHFKNGAAGGLALFEVLPNLPMHALPVGNGQQVIGGLLDAVVGEFVGGVEVNVLLGQPVIVVEGDEQAVLNGGPEGDGRVCCVGAGNEGQRVQVKPAANAGGQGERHLCFQV